MPRPTVKPTNRVDAIREELKSAAEHGMVRTKPISMAPNFRVSGSTPVKYSHNSTILPVRAVMEANDHDFVVARPQRLNPFLLARHAGALVTELKSLITRFRAHPPARGNASASELFEKLSTLAANTDDQHEFATLRDATLDAVLGEGTSHRINEAIKASGNAQGGTAQ